MKYPRLLCCTLFLTLLRDAHVEAQPNKLPRLPAAALLVGYHSLLLGRASQFLAVATPRELVMVLPELGQRESGDGTPVYPSISSDGTVVACLRVKPETRSRVVVATYFVPDKRWIDYDEADHVYGVAISPDKSQLAFVSTAREGDPARLYVLNTKAGASRALASEHISIDSAPSWSPDGSRIAYQVYRSIGGPTYESAIDVADVATGSTRRLGNGQNPAWSPSGEWIAYLDSSGTWPVTMKCLAAHPDGTGEQVLYAFPRGHAFFGQRYFTYAPVWSPDSKKLLLNERLEGDEPVVNERMKIHLLDFATHKLTTKFRHTPPVLGWAVWK